MNSGFNFIGENEIEKIKNTISIIDVISYYTVLSKRGKNLVGICPLCKKYRLTVSPGKKIMKCFNCGLGGNVINFIKKYENLTFRETLDFIQLKFIKTIKNKEYIVSNPLRGYVYVLELENACYYIGFTKNLELRIAQHFEGNGAIWTQIKKPIKVLEVFEEKTLNYENYITNQYMIKYGYSKVKGGDHIYFKEKYNPNGKMFD